MWVNPITEKCLLIKGIRRWLFPSALDGLNELLEGRDINSFDLARFDNAHNRELTVNDLPSWPITEEDVRDDPSLIRNIAMCLLTIEESRSIGPESLLKAEWWLFPGRLERLNELLEGRDINGVDLNRFNIIGEDLIIDNITIDDLPTWPITKEDVHRAPRFIEAIASDLLIAEERRSLESENLLQGEY